MSKNTICGLEVHVTKDYYNGLWNIRYRMGGTYAGPYKTKREATEYMNKFVADDAEARLASPSMQQGSL